MTICYDQPHLIPPPPKIESRDVPPSTPLSWHTSTPITAGSRQLASRASSRASFTRTIRKARTTESLRPTIGTPENFRRVDDYKRRSEVFRPLELSIYQPENKLSPLPVFSETFEKEPARLEYPAQALMRSRSSTVLSQSTSTLRIPRKPVGSISDRTTIRPRPSADRLSYASSFDAEWGRTSQLDSSSTQELLAALERRLPKAPPPLRIRSQTEPLHLPQRRESLVHRRVNNALDEKQEVDRRLNDFDTIIEEMALDPKEDLPKSPIPPAVPSKTADDEEGGGQNGSRDTSLPSRVPVRSATFSDISSIFHRPLPPTPLTFNQPNPSSSPAPPPPPPKSGSESAPSVLVCPSSQPVVPSPPVKFTSTRDRVSQWLFPTLGSVGDQSSPEPVLSHDNFYQCVAKDSPEVPSMVSTVSSRSASFEAATPANNTPQSSPGRSRKSMTKGSVRIVADQNHPLPPCPPCEVHSLSSGLSGRSPVGVAF